MFLLKVKTLFVCEERIKVSTGNNNYERIAGIIVSVKGILDKEKLSAEKDLADYTENLGSMKNVKTLGKGYTPKEYNAYLSRTAGADDIYDDFSEDVDRLYGEKNIRDRMAELTAELKMQDISLRDSGLERQADYEAERDRIEDELYEMKNTLKEKYDKQKKKSSKRSSSKKSTSKKKTDTQKDKTEMPEFASTENTMQSLTNDIYAESFRKKAEEISAGGTKKADINELNSLLKLAEKYGAGDSYLKWLSEYCGY